MSDFISAFVSERFSVWLKCTKTKQKACSQPVLEFRFKKLRLWLAALCCTLRQVLSVSFYFTSEHQNPPRVADFSLAAQPGSLNSAQLRTMTQVFDARYLRRPRLQAT